MSKVKNNVPNWLLKVPEGFYTIKDLQEITKQSRINIWIRLNSLEVSFKKVVKNEAKKYASNLYEWKGAKFYLLKQFDEKLEKISEEMQVINEEK